MWCTRKLKFSHTLLKSVQGWGSYNFSWKTIPENDCSRVEWMFVVILCGSKWSKSSRMQCNQYGVFWLVWRFQTQLAYSGCGLISRSPNLWAIAWDISFYKLSVQVALEVTWSICLLKLRSDEMRTPRYLASGTVSNTWPWRT